MIGGLYIWGGLVWRVLARGEPFDRGPRRNVLVEQVDSLERCVRPFRGLRRHHPPTVHTERTGAAG